MVGTVPSRSRRSHGRDRQGGHGPAFAHCHDWLHVHDCNVIGGLMEYDVLGNERHKAICKLREMPKLYPNKDGGADLYAWKRELADAIGADTELFSAIRDRLIHLLGGDEPKFSDLFGIWREDDDGVDARPSDSASADSPVHGAAGCGCGVACGCDGEELLAPITTELRDNMRIYGRFSIDDGKQHVELEADTFAHLCDAIDSVHAQLERDYQTACVVNEHQDLEYIDLAKRYDNTISLPLDKDGVLWRIGDELLDDGMRCEVVGIGPNRLYYYVDATDTVEWTQADSRRHYTPTVEDLILDAISRCVGHSPEYWDKPIAECAAKLRLADAQKGADAE